MTLIIQTRHIHHAVALAGNQAGRAVHGRKDRLRKRSLDRVDGSIEGLRDIVHSDKGDVHVNGHVPRRRVTVDANKGVGTHGNSRRILIQIAKDNSIRSRG